MRTGVFICGVSINWWAGWADAEQLADDLPSHVAFCECEDKQTEQEHARERLAGNYDTPNRRRLNPGLWKRESGETGNTESKGIDKVGSPLRHGDDSRQVIEASVGQ